MPKARIKAPGVSFQHHFTKTLQPNQDVAELFTWTRRRVEVKDEHGVVTYSADVEAPDFWSDLAFTVAAKTWFRRVCGVMESSVKDMFRREADALYEASKYPDVGSDYFGGDEARRRAFRDEIFFVQAAQYVMFNTPVHVNLGVATAKHATEEGQAALAGMTRRNKTRTIPRTDEHINKWGVFGGQAPNAGPQCSACFIQSVDDTMESLCALQTSETQLFRRGSGTGSNLSALRPAGSPLGGGGTASGPVSFMRGLDAWAGVTKSGGSSRRAALMRVLDVYHPDIVDFIKTKSTAQKMIRDLGKQGWDVGFNATATTWTPYQNANQSVRVDDAFMTAATTGQKIRQHWPTQWGLNAGGDVTAEVKGAKIWGDCVEASKLLDDIAAATHDCGDPGMQYDTTINKWHTCKASGRINGSNPCLRGDVTLKTRDGEIAISELIGRDVEIFDGEEYHPAEVWQSGVEGTLTIELSDGKTLTCTPQHTIGIAGGWAFAHRLRAGDKVRTVNGDAAVLTVDYDPTSVAVYDFTMKGPRSVGYANGIVVSNCSEYMFLDDSACNLASLRLTKFLLPNGDFDVDTFTHVARTMFIAQEILVGASSYPTQAIAKNSHDFRPLGLGYCDLGAMLMQLGLPYDSDAGRSVCAAVTSLLGGVAYRTSAELARDCGGPFAGWELNRESMLGVIDMHCDAAVEVSTDGGFGDVAVAGVKTWNMAHDLGMEHGFRNSQATVLAPTGTIGFALDCDTTGIEPDTALVKRKKLAGGGVLEYVNGSVAPALRRLGYDADSIENITSTIKRTGTIPVSQSSGGQRDFDLAPQHLAVFATAFGQPDNEVSVGGHLKMMAAAQPFLSGAISKTVNVPSHYTVAQIRDVFVEAWRLGLKAVAVYRDGSKDQPLEAKTDAATSTSKLPSDGSSVTSGRIVGVTLGVCNPLPPSRRRLPTDTPSLRHKFSIGGVDGYVHLGFYDDARTAIGEIFVRMEPKAGDAQTSCDLATQAASVAIQHGATVESFLDRWEGTRFAPSGFTGEGGSGIAWASSPLDYLAKWLRGYLGRRDLMRDITAPAVAAAMASARSQDNVTAAPLPPPIPATTTQPSSNQAPSSPFPCPRCGNPMRQDGACRSCPACGHGQGGCGA